MTSSIQVSEVERAIEIGLDYAIEAANERGRTHGKDEVFDNHMKDIAFFERVQSAMRSKDHSIAVDDVRERLREWALDKAATHHRLAHENQHLRGQHIASSSAYRNLADEITAIGSQSIEGERAK